MLIYLRLLATLGTRLNVAFPALLLPTADCGYKLFELKWFPIFLILMKLWSTGGIYISFVDYYVYCP